jgi:hypothetical protein
MEQPTARVTRMWRWVAVLLVLLGLVYVGLTIADHFFNHYINATAMIAEAPGMTLYFPKANYVATIDVRMGDPVDLACTVSTDGTGPIGSDSFTIPDADGVVSHSGTLHLKGSGLMDDFFDIACESSRDP